MEVKTLRNKFLPVGIMIVGLSVTGCSSVEDQEIEMVENQGAAAMYKTAKTSLENGNFSGAAQLLSSIDSRFPFGPLSHQVQLDLIYAYYKSRDVEKTLATIDRFIRLNPNHADVEYALYMRGLSNMEQDTNLFQDLFGVDRADRDPSKSREAFEDFRRLLEKFPDTKYSADAKQRMLYIKSRLAKYEIHVARFYMRREAWVAAANRGRYVIEYYSDTEHVQSALEIMVASYDQLGLEELKSNSMKMLKLNYPDSEFIQ